ncbi:type II toxin-antitoxin system RelE/ParE family toxin [Haloferula chungangensis]|uniref:Type II toxin-antitoxin system RelE/ParE family toxin n=1 Tax=Haloferula chungangensis TaxID=1048331 RepID=A0ABW2L370_9BACT
MASYKVEFAKQVQKDFRKIPKPDAEKILRQIAELATQPFPSNSKKLKGEELYRVRIGNYRVIYEIHGDRLVITVVKVGHRKDVY